MRLYYTETLNSSPDFFVLKTKKGGAYVCTNQMENRVYFKIFYLCESLKCTVLPLVTIITGFPLQA